ncbi:MAG: hypothetical protein R3B95_17550 [Nitrospirales bacterium]|nr:hypothetical protein [Nitrospirales bacterium]
MLNIDRDISLHAGAIVPRSDTARNQSSFGSLDASRSRIGQAHTRTCQGYPGAFMHHHTLGYSGIGLVLHRLVKTRAT